MTLGHTHIHWEGNLHKKIMIGKGTSPLLRIRTRLRSVEPLGIQFLDPFNFKGKLFDQKRPWTGSVFYLNSDGDHITGSVHFPVRFQLQLRRIDISAAADGGRFEPKEWESPGGFISWRHYREKFPISGASIRWQLLDERERLMRSLGQIFKLLLSFGILFFLSGFNFIVKEPI